MTFRLIFVDLVNFILFLIILEPLKTCHLKDICYSKISIFGICMDLVDGQLQVKSNQMFFREMIQLITPEDLI